MPTKYTEMFSLDRDNDGKDYTFEDYVLRCAKKFILITKTKGYPIDEPFPDIFYPNEEYLNKLEETVKERRRIMEIDFEELYKERGRDLEDRRKRYSKELSHATAQEHRYNDILTIINNWNVPGSSYYDLKEFMMDELKYSLKIDVKKPVDCTNEIEYELNMSIEDYKNYLLTRLSDEIIKYEEAWQEEIERVKKANEWLKTLRLSIREYSINKECKYNEKETV